MSGIPFCRPEQATIPSEQAHVVSTSPVEASLDACKPKCMDRVVCTGGDADLLKGLITGGRLQLPAEGVPSLILGLRGRFDVQKAYQSRNENRRITCSLTSK